LEQAAWPGWIDHPHQWWAKAGGHWRRRKQSLLGALDKAGLTKWDPYLFAQGVVIFAFEDLLPDGERMAVAKRAVTWADSTVDAKSVAK